jgi:hypothetical protein
MPFDRFALDLDRFAWSTPSPPAPEHAVDLDCFADALGRAEHAVDLDCFTDAPDHALRSTPSFPSPQVIHEELVNYCLVLIVHCSDLFTHKYVIRFLHKNFVIDICIV